MWGYENIEWSSDRYGNAKHSYTKQEAVEYNVGTPLDFQNPYCILLLTDRDEETVIGHRFSIPMSEAIRIVSEKLGIEVEILHINREYFDIIPEKITEGTKPFEKDPLFLWASYEIAIPYEWLFDYPCTISGYEVAWEGIIWDIINYSLQTKEIYYPDFSTPHIETLRVNDGKKELRHQIIRCVRMGKAVVDIAEPMVITKR
jgi:hypothetical protein